MKYTSLEISKIIDGKLEGDKNIIINSISEIENGKKGDICFLANSKYEHFLYTTKASVIIIDNELKLKKSLKSTIIRVKDPYLSLSKISKRFEEKENIRILISEKSYISKSAKIGINCYIGPFVFIGDNVTIGDNTKIYANCNIEENVTVGKDSILYAGVKIYKNCKIGNKNIIHCGAVLGADGFGFAPIENSNYNKIHQIGNVITYSDVEIGANTTIDRATLGSTIINKGVKLDNLIQIGHNVEIGENTVIAGLVGIAGSTKIGKNCMIGGSSGIAGHLKIGNNVRIAGNSGVGSNIKNDSTIQGPYAFNQKDYLRSYVYFKQLPKILKRLESLIKKGQT